jgi:hypothetical protein
MSTSEPNSDWLVAPFGSVALEDLNARAPMLERIDNKYIIGRAALTALLPQLATHFGILEVDGHRQFAYENCYFDGPSLQSYYDHHQGRRRRNKVRTRRYVGQNLCFVEVKLKDRRGITVKRRLACDPSKYGTLDSAAYEHINSAHREMYQEEFRYELRPSIETSYRRVSLVAHVGQERMTIDSALAFNTAEKKILLDDLLYIVETKSPAGNGLADRILRNLHQHPIKNCSKYCAGLALLQTGLKHNRFNPVLRQLGITPMPKVDATSRSLP